MTATLTRPTTHSSAANESFAPRSRPVSLTRLTRVELRKSVDTRSGRWLLAVLGLIVLAAVGIASFAGNDTDHVFSGITQTAALVAAILLPVVGVLLVTSEWSQRTAQTTFTLTPRRGRVIAAKAFAGVLLGLIAGVVCIAVGALGTLISSHATGVEVWDMNVVTVVQILLYLAVYVLFGIGFGLLFLNSPIAIVTFFALPTAWTIASNSISALSGVRDWLDPTTTLNYLLDNSVSAEHWARTGTTVLVWIVVPAVVGTVRVLRRSIG